MRRAPIVVVALLAVVGGASAARSTTPPPPPNRAAQTVEWPNLESIAGNKGEYGSLQVNYVPWTQTLTWSLDYIGTTGPATSLRLRMRLAHGRVLSLSLCRPSCRSVPRTNGKGKPYFRMTGTIVRPTRDLFMMATLDVSTDVVLGTAQYPKGELRADNVIYPTVGSTNGGKCC